VEEEEVEEEEEEEKEKEKEEKKKKKKKKKRSAEKFPHQRIKVVYGQQCVDINNFRRWTAYVCS
jgi:hypothetical protein